MSVDESLESGVLSRPWSRETQELVEALEVDADEGLLPEQVTTSRSTWGANVLETERGRGWLARLISQFNNLLIQVLLVAAALTAYFEEWLETGVILAVVVVNAVIGFVQEGKAEEALRAIRDMLSPSARVLRAGHRETVDATELVVGDILLLQAGDRVAADVRILQARGLQTQEAMLTGESVPVTKTAAPVAEDTPLAERSAMAFSGTLVTGGQGVGLVVATGARTELGRISGMLSDVTEIKTPLLRSMDTFARWLSIAILGVATLLFLLGVFIRGQAAEVMFMKAVAIAVAAIPEGLPAILTVTLAIGVQRMARRHAIIRRLPAVETLGALDVICSDKTGTLTRNELVVRRIATRGGFWAITGTGYGAEGGLVEVSALDAEVEDGDPLEAPPSISTPIGAALRAMALCNDAEVLREGDEWKIDGDPLEAALLVAARRARLDDDDLRERNPKLDVVPFSSEHKYMATLHAGEAWDDPGGEVLLVKGAPDTLLDRASTQRESEGSAPLDRAWWEQRLTQMAEEGQRVLGVAIRHLRSRPGVLEDGVEDLEMLGLFGFLDPPRDEAIRAVTDAQTAGITVKMITGDHSGTARAIAGQLGLRRLERVLVGRDLEGMDEDELAACVGDVDVYARTTPEHKLRLVRAIQAQGAVVAMTGDGVNDAPALKQADIGIAMGKRGTEAARQVADMVLQDDAFETIVMAVEQGRVIFANIRKSVMFMLTTNVAEVIAVTVATVAGWTLPLLPLQILYLNVLTDVFPALALGVGPAGGDEMRQPPRNPREAVLTGKHWQEISGLAAVIAASVLGGLLIGLRWLGMSELEAVTISFLTLAFGKLWFTFNLRSPKSGMLRNEVTRNPWVWGAIGLCIALLLAAVYLPVLSDVLQTRELDWRGWGLILVMSVIPLLAGQLLRELQRRRA